MRSSKGTFAAINLLVSLLPVAIMLIIYASFKCWPAWEKPTQIIYWISFIVCPLINIIWTICILVRPQREVAATIIHVWCNLALQVLPFVNLIFTAFPAEWEWIIAFPLVIDLLVLVAYAIVMLYSSNWSKKVNATAQRVQATSHRVVNQDTAYNNDDGSFRGSRLKK